METLAVLPLSQPSFFPSKPLNKSNSFPSWPCKQQSSYQYSTRLNCHKMYVPGPFASPEKQASKNLHNFFNYIAVKIVSAQLEMVDDSNTKLMREYVLETSDVKEKETGK
ncbi:hypothetical protein CCACVL1_15363 [Corchorus capsularis]|uniref:Uncharacterized protein n=1 Tax=Corchorus capsularis TaxID=210143 RepID=A0A1R3I2U4_COCAP|nr:hypothetical protein CCACVL1_15363 [Corchorus capsularis]